MPNTRTLTPSMPGRVKFATSSAPCDPSQSWSQIRHHQDNSRAKGRHGFCGRPGRDCCRWRDVTFEIPILGHAKTIANLRLKWNGLDIETMSAKDILLEVSEKLPPEATLNDAIHELEFRQAVLQGLDE